MAHKLKPLPQPTTPQPTTPLPQPKLYCTVRLDRNFMNYPLARSARTVVRWHQDQDVLWCRLPGEDHVELSVPATAPVRRLATGFDINVLFRLLAGVQDSNKDTYRFASVAALLRELHLTAHSDNCARVLNALELWGYLTIFHGLGTDPAAAPHETCRHQYGAWTLAAKA